MKGKKKKKKKKEEEETGKIAAISSMKMTPYFSENRVSLELILLFPLSK